MAITVRATFDGEVFRPLEPVPLPPGTLVRLTFEPVQPVGPEQGRPYEFLDIVEAAALQGPPDWSARLSGSADADLAGNDDEAARS
ncbi:MAG TPA: antitoxin family protein [Longimicrobium sp.]|nr:antitoxin family protein [Longimicrobium sp.]